MTVCLYILNYIYIYQFKEENIEKWQTAGFVTVPSGYHSLSTWCFLSKCWSLPSFVQLSRSSPQILFKHAKRWHKERTQTTRTETEALAHRSRWTGVNERSKKAAERKFFPWLLVQRCKMIYMREQLNKKLHLDVAHSLLYLNQTGALRSPQHCETAPAERGRGKKRTRVCGWVFLLLCEWVAKRLEIFQDKKVILWTIPSLISFSVNIQTGVFP